MNRPVDITALLEAWNQGDLEARDRLIPAVYDELRRRAAAFLRRERAGQTLDPTALVHEVYLRLVDQDRAVWQNRAQFLAVASEMMRILVDRARAHKMVKRSGRWARVTLADDAARGTQRDVDVLDLHNALDELSAFDQRKARVAELRFFGGLSLEETGLVLGTSLATTMRDWQAAREELLGREKAHTREGDAIAAARRRLPMVEVDASLELTGPDGPVTLLDAFEGRRQLIAYYFMWWPGHPAADQCEGCTWVTTQVSELSYLHSRDITFAVFCQGRNVTYDTPPAHPYDARPRVRCHLRGRCRR
jgi:RNA polymerase sigma factor (TIGR02999 family)